MVSVENGTMLTWKLFNINHAWPHMLKLIALGKYQFWNLFNSLALGNFEWKFRHVIFKQILVIDGWGISC